MSHLYTGQPNDTEAASGDGTAIALLKRLRTLLTGQVPTAHAYGESTAPAAAAVIADTGPLAAGTYEVIAHAAASGVVAAGKHLAIEHRNAANNGNLHGHLVPAAAEGRWTNPRLTIALNERIRVVVGAAFAANEVARGDIYVRPVP